MTQQGTQQKAPWTARQWFAVVILGGLTWLIGGIASRDVGAIGLMVATFGAIGLVWRLLRSR